jgi:hypothetical protein
MFQKGYAMVSQGHKLLFFLALTAEDKIFAYF